MTMAETYEAMRAKGLDYRDIVRHQNDTLYTIDFALGNGFLFCRAEGQIRGEKIHLDHVELVKKIGLDFTKR